MGKFALVFALLLGRCYSRGPNLSFRNSFWQPLFSIQRNEKNGLRKDLQEVCGRGLRGLSSKMLDRATPEVEAFQNGNVPSICRTNETVGVERAFFNGT